MVNNQVTVVLYLCRAGVGRVAGEVPLAAAAGWGCRQAEGAVRQAGESVQCPGSGGQLLT